MEVNKVILSDWMKNDLPPNSVDLIIVDPPYFEVKGDFDFAWNSFEEYLTDVELWAEECYRVLKKNGTLLWWGDAKKIAYTQIILDKKFRLLNSLVWQKKDGQTLRSSVKDMRSFAPVTERLLMYDRGESHTGLQRILNDNTLFRELKIFFDEWLKGSGLNLSEAVKQIGSSCTHWFGFSLREKQQFEMPTKEKWGIMNTISPLKRSHESLMVEYESLMVEYENKRRFFRLNKMQSDVLLFSQESHITKNYKHDTKKPETLTRFLIKTCARKGDKVLVPFAGSGTECAMAAREGLNFIGFDINKAYVEMATDRVKKELTNLKMF